MKWQPLVGAGLLSTRFLMFVVVGALNTAFSYAIFAGLLWLGCHYALATLLASAIGVGFNFQTTGRIVFQNHDSRRLLLYVWAQVAGYLVSIIAQRLLHAVGVNAYIGGLLAIAPSVIVVYNLCTRIVFVRTATPVNGTRVKPFPTRGSDA